MKQKSNLWVFFSLWVFIGWGTVLYLRIVETLSLMQHHYIFNLFENELIGIGVDIVMVSAFLAMLFPVFYLFSRLSCKAANIFMGTVLVVASVFHIVIIQYFAQTSIPLGGMLIRHTFSEVFFTVRTAGANYQLYAIMFITAIALLGVFWIILKKGRLRPSICWAVTAFSALTIIINILINNSFNHTEQEAFPNSIRLNKSYYFYKNIFSILRHPYSAGQGTICFSERETLFPDKKFVSEQFPLLSETQFQDALGDFFNVTTNQQLPNIVVIIVEGLGSRFLPDFHGLTLMPFLDSLSNESLHWNKALTVGERSYSVVPSLLASAPYGNRGFTFENENLLSLSLVNMLSKNNYFSTFFYGQPKWFHNKGPYLYRNGLHKFVDCWQFPEKYSKIMVGDYFWGHHDQNLVKYALEYINDSLPESPRLDIFFTGTMHSPFFIEKEELYNQRLQNLIEEAELDKQQRKFMLTYQKYIRSVMFTDDALRLLVAGYEQHPSFKNTIFIITGDHPMTEIPIENSFQRYRTPVIIYSPLLKQAKKFHSINSHLDIAPTLLAFLHKNYHIQIPELNPFIGKILNTDTGFRNIQPVVFMNGNRLMADIFFQNYFLVNEKTLFKVDENDRMERIEDNLLKEKMVSLLQNFRRLNDYCCTNNKLIPDTLYYNHTGNSMIYKFENQAFQIPKEKEYDTVIDELLFSGAGKYFFDFKVNETSVLNKEYPTLVLELIIRETGERISWNGFHLEEHQGFLHFLFDIQNDKEMLLKSYFWNNQQVECNLPNTSCHFYRVNP